MLKLHLGCGVRNFGEGWVHIDAGTFPHVTSHDVTKLPYEDNSVDLIYSSHMICYFDRLEVVPLLAEWYRVLKPGGICRIATPDFQAMAGLYSDGIVSLSQILGPLFGRWQYTDEQGEINTIYIRTAYDLPSLCKVLKETGFREYARYDWRHTEHSMFDDHSRAHLPNSPEAIASGNFDGLSLISLNVEARK